MSALEAGAVVVVGSELLREGRVDTNGPWIASQLDGAGIRPVLRLTVGDDLEAIAGALAHAAGLARALVVCGGLGPTFDDLTREGTARAFGLPLLRHSDLADAIRGRYGARGLVAPPEALRMADLLAGAEPLPNSVGSAPGQFLPGPPALALVPGVPSEMTAMMRDEVMPRLRRLHPGDPPERMVLKIAGLYESQVESRVGPLLAGHTGSDATILAAPGEITLILRGKPGSGPEVGSLADAVVRELGEAVYAREEEGIEAVVGRMLEERKATLATAESCTGGMLGSLITRVPGSSGWYAGGAVCYDDRLKRDLLEVPGELLEEHGAVSEAVALAMAAGARRRMMTDYALSVTGVAGPGGGTPEKPVGLVWVGLDGRGVTRAVRLRLGGSRDVIRQVASRGALNLLRLGLLRRDRALGKGEAG